MKENNIDISKVEDNANKFLESGKTVLYFAKENNIIRNNKCSRLYKRYK